MRTRSIPPAHSRRGVVLLVVITLLTLFAVVGITFVIYAQAEATASRTWRESEGLQRPDMDPEMLLAYFLNQLIYDTNNPHSALRGHSLARTMYGDAGNTVPFNGTGRRQGTSYNNINYQMAGGTTPTVESGLNAPYTYPDLNNCFLAAVRASDGAVLLPSYQRNAFVADATQQVQCLRPLRSATTNPDFPAMEDLGGDVKNLAGSPGFLVTPPNTFANNDSIWVDLGFPVMKAPDGRKFKPLFAPLIQDLDNRVNVNVHGYWFVHSNGANAAGTFQSNQGWGPWEVNPVQALGNGDELRNLMRGSSSPAGKGRYDMDFWGTPTFSLSNTYYMLPAGHSYAPTDLDCNIAATTGVMTMPTGGNCFPRWDNTYGNGYLFAASAEALSHPRNYNFFSPEQNGWSNAGTPRDRRFGAGSMEALLRYGDTGSPSLTSPLFSCCPTIFADAAKRRLATTHSFDLLRPGVVPWITDNGAAYTLASGGTAPSGGAIAQAGAAGTGEYSASWGAITAGLRRIDLNRKMTEYPTPDATSKQITDTAGFATSQRERQAMAREIFDVLRKVTGAAMGDDPSSWPDPTTDATRYNALRWLAQLAVNIVDYVDLDDYSTPFNWNLSQTNNVERGWVFGTECPRLVINEVYAEVRNDPDDPGLPTSRAQNPFKVCFWVELYNPLDGRSTIATGAAQERMPFTENGNARLYVPGSGSGYGAYQIVVADPAATLRAADNVLGKVDDAQIKSLVTDFTPETPYGKQMLALTGDELNIVKPSQGALSGTTSRNEGYFVVGSKYPFPGTATATEFFATLAVTANTQPTGKDHRGLNYDLPLNTDLTTLPKHTIVLRRLACPHLPENTTPGADYNPYISVDFMEEVPTNDAIQAEQNNAHAGQVTVDNRVARGRKQPFAGDKSQHVDQAAINPAPTPAQPKHTLFKFNNPPAEPNVDWLVATDRLLISPAELLHVSAFKPHELTQQFIAPDGAKFKHEAPWFSSDARIFRLFEFLEAGTRYQWSPVGGRTVGRINLNTVWDVETFRAICDVQGVNASATSAVDKFYAQMIKSRMVTNQVTPGASDRPFRGFAPAYTAATDGIQDTWFRADPDNPGKRLLETDAADRKTGLQVDHPYLKYEMMRKIFNNVTTRSNVFAVWVTVGFFEADDSDATRPPRLGKEIGRDENRHIRHRMFAIVDRSNLSVSFDTATGAAQMGTAGPRPFFLEAETAVTAAGAATITIPALSGQYEDQSWSIANNTWLMVDVGTNQESVQVTGTGTDANGRPTFTATFTRPHPIGFAISNALLGHPGPQSSFDMRNSKFTGIVRHFSIIQ